MPCHAMPCHAMPCHAMPCHAMPCHAMPCHAMPCHAMPCHHNRWTKKLTRYVFMLPSPSSPLHHKATYHMTLTAPVLRPVVIYCIYLTCQEFDNILQGTGDMYRCCLCCRSDCGTSAITCEGLKHDRSFIIRHEDRRYRLNQTMSLIGRYTCVCDFYELTYVLRATCHSTPQ